MARYKKIPVVKSRVVITKKKGHPKLTLFAIILSGCAIMIFYIWLKVQINLQLTEIQQLELRYRQQMLENEKSHAEVIRLSSYARIHEIAQENLGLVFLAQEDIHEVPK